MTYYYDCLLRPPTPWTVPKGYEMIARGELLDTAPLRTDLPFGGRYGVIGYPEPVEDPESWDLKLLTSYYSMQN